MMDDANHDCVVDMADVASALAPGCSSGGDVLAAAVGCTSLYQLADEIDVVLGSLGSDEAHVLERDVLHRIAERARAVARIVGVMHRCELVSSGRDRHGGTFRAAERSDDYAAEE
jgi:hypothetical protein